jgi:hypothetical protein
VPPGEVAAVIVERSGGDDPLGRAFGEPRHDLEHRGPVVADADA